MTTTGVSTPRGYEAIVTVRMPAPFRDRAVAYLAAITGEAVVSEEAIIALFQQFIDCCCFCQGQDDPLSCDPGGGMRSPDEYEEEAALV
jgi:hypothetical protein